MKIIIVLSFCIISSLEIRQKSSINTIGKIVGGFNAKSGQFPYIVSLRYPDPNKHYCSGTIITKRYVLTAAHCCEGVQPARVTLVAGTNRLDKGGHKYKLKDIHIHPSYNHSENEFSNDICLMHLSSSIKENRFIKHIPLKQDEDDKAQKAAIAGWGRTESFNPLPNLLQWLPTNIVPHKECVDAWGSAAHFPIRKNQICAFSEEEEGPCRADSGGPLIVLDKKADPILAGIVSWGEPCAQGLPDIYTKVGSFTDWIRSVIYNKAKKRDAFEKFVKKI